MGKIKPDKKEVSCEADLQYWTAELADKLAMEKIEKEPVYLSIVVPAYNERQRLPTAIFETILWCRNNIASYEVIIVDDGSSDGTLEAACLFSQFDENVRVLACPHLGKGSAVRMGMLNASGKFVLFMDADLATPLSEIPKLVSALNMGYDLAIGSRIVQKEGPDVEINMTLHRRIIGRTFAAFVKLFGVRGIADTQCGFKMFNAGIIRKIFYRQKINGFAFDVEVLYIAGKLSLSIAEIPVNWEDKKGSKVNVFRDSLIMLWDIIHINWLHRVLKPIPEKG
jgi:dolichyl-phosphate beta-glucosyltransferase